MEVKKKILCWYKRECWRMGGVEATRDFILLVSLWTRRRWKFQANSHTLTVWVTRAASSVLIGRLCWERIELLQQKCFCSVWSAGPQSPSVLGPNNEALSLVADVTFTYCDSKTGTTKGKKIKNGRLERSNTSRFFEVTCRRIQFCTAHTHTRVEKLMRRVQE